MPDMNPALAKALAEHSPRLPITGPTLVPSPGSPTGWLVVEPVDCPTPEGR
jgi:hypothetical protein